MYVFLIHKYTKYKTQRKKQGYQKQGYAEKRLCE